MKFNGLSQLPHLKLNALAWASLIGVVCGAQSVHAQLGQRDCAGRDIFSPSSIGCDPFYPGSEAIRGADMRGKTGLEDVDDQVGRFTSPSSRGARGSGIGQWSLYTAPSFANERDNNAEGLGGFSFGVDYSVSEWARAGVAFGHVEDEHPDDDEVNASSRSVTLYGSFAPREGSFLDVYAGYADLDLEGEGATRFERRENVRDGERLAAGIAGGLDWTRGAFTTGARARMDFSGTEFEEPDADDVLISQSLTSQLGLESSIAQPFRWGVLMPRASLAYVHEFANESDSRSLLLNPESALSEQVDAADRDYFIGGLGASAGFANGFELYIEYERLLGHRFIDAWAVSGGVRHQF